MKFDDDAGKTEDKELLEPQIEFVNMDVLSVITKFRINTN